jgi:hypothetical protein
MVSVEARTRPLRLLFLVDWRKTSEVVRAMRLCAGKWGGIHHGIVPASKAVPSWVPNPPKQLTGPRITTSYLDAFEPDYIVEGQPGAAEMLDIPDDQVVQISDLSSDDVAIRSNYGVSALDIYREAYRREMQFVLREPRTFSLVAGIKGFDPKVVSCLFGDFAPDSQDYLRQGFQEAFHPDELSLLSMEEAVDLYVST